MNKSGTKRNSTELLLTSNNKNMKMLTDSTDKLCSSERCIQEILRHLPIKDLANVSLGSQFLKTNAKIVFKKMHAASIDVYYDEDDTDSFHLVFRQFGSLAARVKVMALSDVDDRDIFRGVGYKILRTISHFCGTNLKDLTLCGVKIDLSSKVCPYKIFSEVRCRLSTLTKLTLINIYVRSKFLKFATSLNELVILNCRMEKLPEVAVLPQLRKISVGACSHWPFIMGGNFEDFLCINSSIEELDYDLNIGGDRHLHSICCLSKLRSLNIVLVDYNQQLLSLLVSISKRLKKLSIRGHQEYSNIKNMVPNGCEFSFEKYC